MKNLKSFMVLSVSGMDRVSYRYEEIGENGEPVSKDNSGNFYAVDAELEAHIEAIRDFIRVHKLEG